jgi:predicted AAA+ superfamily ATPase
MQETILRADLLKRLERRLSKRPVVALLGARQVGKTTLARNHASGVDGEISFFDLERPSDHAALSANPEQILSQAEGLVVIDEVQRMPELFTLLRPLVDSPERKAQFLLLGSASWDLVKGISETLGADRVHQCRGLLSGGGGCRGAKEALAARRISRSVSGG